MSLFDVPLHFNFYRASTAGDDIDLTHILDGSLVSVDPIHAVTFVDNHDTQPDQAPSSPQLSPGSSRLPMRSSCCARQAIPASSWATSLASPTTRFPPSPSLSCSWRYAVALPTASSAIGLTRRTLSAGRARARRGNGVSGRAASPRARATQQSACAWVHGARG